MHTSRKLRPQDRIVLVRGHSGEPGKHQCPGLPQNLSPVSGAFRIRMTPFHAFCAGEPLSSNVCPLPHFIALRRSPRLAFRWAASLLHRTPCCSQSTTHKSSELYCGLTNCSEHLSPPLPLPLPTSRRPTSAGNSRTARVRRVPFPATRKSEIVFTSGSFAWSSPRIRSSAQAKRIWETADIECNQNVIAPRLDQINGTAPKPTTTE